MLLVYLPNNNLLFLQQPKELFTIRQRQTPTQTRGIITLTGELDFETQSMYTLTMYATVCDVWINTVNYFLVEHLNNTVYLLGSLYGAGKRY